MVIISSKFGVLVTNAERSAVLTSNIKHVLEVSEKAHRVRTIAGI
jgi:hypothetical protein